MKYLELSINLINFTDCTHCHNYSTAILPLKFILSLLRIRLSHIYSLLSISSTSLALNCIGLVHCSLQIYRYWYNCEESLIITTFRSIPVWKSNHLFFIILHSCLKLEFDCQFRSHLDTSRLKYLFSWYRLWQIRLIQLPLLPII